METEKQVRASLTTAQGDFATPCQCDSRHSLICMVHRHGLVVRIVTLAKVLGENAVELELPTKKFIRPTVEEVRSYCKDRKNNVDAETFVDFYASKGWKVGNQPMKDWKAALRRWEKNRDGGSNGKAKKLRGEFDPEANA